VNVDGIKSSIRLHNLKKYTTYFVWISASTSIGTGPTSSKHTFSTAEDGEYVSSFHCATFLAPPPPPFPFPYREWGRPYEQVGDARWKI